MQPTNQLNKLDQIHNSLHSYCDAIPDLDMMTQYDAILDSVMMTQHDAILDPVMTKPSINNDESSTETVSPIKWY